MPDYAGLRAVAEGAVRQPDFTEVTLRATRLRRRNLVTAGAGAVAVATVGAIVAGQVLTGPSPQGAAAEAPREEVKIYPSLEVADAEHLYFVPRTYCTEEDGGNVVCTGGIYASGDGGQTWQSRPVPAEPGQIWGGPSALGPELLLLNLVDMYPPAVMTATAEPTSATTPTGGPKPPSAESTVNLKVSTDGGRTWRTVTRSATPFAGLPDGAVHVPCGALQGVMRFKETCNQVYGLDPASATVAPLAQQPPIFVNDVSSVVASATIWVGGADRASGKPAVSVSRDRGRTWVTKVFDGEGTTTNVVARDRTGYVSFQQDNRETVYRSTDGGTTWQAIQGSTAGGVDYVTADGACISMKSIKGEDGVTFHYEISRDGGSFQPVTVNGLPPDHSEIETAPDGSRSAWQGDAVYLAEDGVDFRQIELP